MKRFKLYYLLTFLVILSFKPESDSDKLNAIIAKYEAERAYGFKRY